LLEEQYAPVGVAGASALSEATELLKQASMRPTEAFEVNAMTSGQNADLKALLNKYTQREDAIQKYIKAYRNYCWSVSSFDDYKLAPFHLLATENAMYSTKDHIWHMDIIKNANPFDDFLSLHNFGDEQCNPKQHFPPTVRDFYLIHYIVDGKGRFNSEKREYSLGKGQIFLIEPGELVSYTADEKEPWHYMWVGFKGRYVPNYLKMLGIGQHNPITAIKDGEKIIKLIDEMIVTEQSSMYGADYKLQGLLYILLGEILSNSFLQQNNPSTDLSNDLLVHKAMQYMTNNYSDPYLSISYLARRYNIDRSYFSRVFKQINEMTAHQYLLCIRMQKAKELLLLTDLNVSLIANSVGYKDYIVFSKAFKAKEKMSPREFRNHKNFILANPVGVLPDTVKTQ
jgi:AraC-like DNA-binding protein/mannose-6-phosphate isomerase-like protein (cupin superfamily)